MLSIRSGFFFVLSNLSHFILHAFHALKGSLQSKESCPRRVSNLPQWLPSHVGDSSRNRQHVRSWSDYVQSPRTFDQSSSPADKHDSIQLQLTDRSLLRNKDLFPQAAPTQRASQSLARTWESNRAIPPFLILPLSPQTFHVRRLRSSPRTSLRRRLFKSVVKSSQGAQAVSVGS